ncbi:MAG: hypothetical protein ACE5D8_06050 [Fidelibacterota bacterium]
MSRTASFKILLTILVSLGLSSVLSAKLLKPVKNGEKKEILIVNSKRRLYYPVEDEGLTYLVQGPTRIEFISRYPYPGKTKKRQSFKYTIILDKSDSIHVSHRYKIQSSIKSVQHPNHSYTYSGNYFINIPDGQHEIRVIPPRSKQKYPVLIRVLSKEFDPPRNKSTVLVPMVSQSARHINIESSVVSYYSGTKMTPLQVEVKGNKTLRIYTRLAFEDWMGREESYRIRVREGKKVIGTYYFSSERSSDAIIAEEPERVPGKWRSCEIHTPDRGASYTIEVVESDREVLMRFLEY